MININKSIVFTLLATLIITPGLSAATGFKKTVSQLASSVLAKSSGYVTPQAAILGLGLGLMGACAYHAYRLPAKEKELSELENVKHTFYNPAVLYIKDLDRIQINEFKLWKKRIHELRKMDSKVTFENQSLFEENVRALKNDCGIIKVGWHDYCSKLDEQSKNKLCREIHARSTPVFAAFDVAISCADEVVEAIKNYRNDSSQEQLIRYRKTLEKCDEKISQALYMYNKLIDVSDSYNSLKRFIFFKKWRIPVALTGFSLALFACINKYRPFIAQALSKK